MVQKLNFVLNRLDMSLYTTDGSLKVEFDELAAKNIIR